MLWCSVYLYYTPSLTKPKTQKPKPELIFDKDLKRLIYLGYWKIKHWKYLVFEKEAKLSINLVELKFAKLMK